MRIVIPASGVPQLEAPSDFEHFSIAVDPAVSGDLPVVLARVAEHASGDDHAWVRPDAVRALSPLTGQADWDSGFRKMINFAASHGWTDDSGRIRAHIEVIQSSALIDAAGFKDAMRRFASGVCVVATGAGDERCGMTVSAFSSVSAEPPTVLVCVNRNSSNHARLTGSQRFSVNILGAGQDEIAMTFAGQRGIFGADRFDAAWQDSPHGAPVLRDAHHSVLCASEAMFEVGSHTILIGRVIDAFAGSSDQPLLNYNGSLCTTAKAA
ncbi:MAG: flavin reductase family protein [Alphaproteobacteria bacterium]|nr:flavin reductase family protein [Alphaproteobacteria bacterium]